MSRNVGQISPIFAAKTQTETKKEYDMRTIGFKNFRRFENLEPLELGGITFFVGGNNAGKSTVVKAMMLMLDNLAASTVVNRNNIFELPGFRLDANRIHEVHVGTFGRALHKPYPEEKVICFESTTGKFHIRYTITGDTVTSQANAEISKIEIANQEKNIQYIFDFNKGESIIRYNTSRLKEFAHERGYAMLLSHSLQAKLHDHGILSDEELQKKIVELQSQRDSLQIEQKSSDDPIRIANLNGELKKIEANIKLVQKTLDPFAGKLKIEDVEYKCTIGVSHRFGCYLSSLILGTIEDLSKVLHMQSHYFAEGIIDEDEDSTKIVKLSLEKKAFARMIEQDARELNAIIIRNNIEYIAAHAASQKVLFSIEDKNDYMAGVIRDFQNCHFVPGSEGDLFVSTWMKTLNIGLGYTIKPIEGEAYTIDITTLQGETMPLADMGMGSIQMTLLLLKLATIINEQKHSRCIVIVEEPEQNIHPKLQSKLAELFTYVHNKYGFRFVIETHSEYMIRKTQAMIAKGYDEIRDDSYQESEQKMRCVTFENNPFRVYYFPEDGEPYDMVYQESGRFKNSFEPGFFDESARWTHEMSKKELEKQPKIEFKW